MISTEGANDQLFAQVAAQLGLSTELPDYVSYFPERAPRADRDRLADKARDDPAFIRRVAIWDFFFLPTPEEIHTLFSQPADSLRLARSTPYDLYKSAEEQLRGRFRAAREPAESDYKGKERQELEWLHHKRREEEEPIRKWRRVGGITLLVGSVVSLFSLLLAEGIEPLLEEAPWFTWVIIATIIGGLIYWASGSRLNQLEQEYASKQAALEAHFRKLLEEEMERLRTEETQALAQLEKGFQELESHLVTQASCIPQGNEVVQWLQEDLDHLRQQILLRTALEPHLVNVRVDPNPQVPAPVGMHLGNPIILSAPAELQTDRIPDRLKEPTQWKHVKAKKYVQHHEHIQLINGVYYLETLLIGTDMLGTYECFFDFIEGTQISERFSEQYYNDIVSIGWTAESLQLSLSSDPSASKVISLDRVPTFTLSLSNGERSGFSIATQDYAQQVLSLLTKSEAYREHFPAEGNFLLVDQASMILDTILRVLRAQLRRHKRSVEDQIEDLN